jgi:threonine aldolase
MTVPSNAEDEALKDFRAARNASKRSLVDLSMARRPVREWLEEVAMEATPEEIPDMYGEGELIANFESKIAELLGKESAVFMPTGTMAQQIALRIWADRQGTRRVAFHPRCHLEIHEQKAYATIHQLEGVLVGQPTQLITLQDLERLPGRIAALLLELPQREIGGQLPSWDELSSQIAWARGRQIRLHVDGARLWEAAAAMGRPLAEIAGLFDSVYVSIYKAIGGISGALLAGPEDFIVEARVWQQRHGGRLPRMFPLVVAARGALGRRLERFPLYWERALRLAAAIREVPGVRIVPDPPHAHMMHVYVPGEREDLLRCAASIARRHGVALFRNVDRSEVPGYCKIELEIGEDALQVSDAEVTRLYRELVEASKVPA